MAQLFPPWANRAPALLGVALLVGALLAVGAVWYFFSPRYTDVGYMPRQPVAFSHKLHAGELKVDCRYCHSSVEVSTVASVPPTRTCMNCHRLVGRKLESFARVRESDELGEPIRWLRVHDLPDYAYFDHSLHLRAGVGCVSCHGDVAAMEEIRQVEPLSMGWCLDCHRHPAPHLRPASEITSARPVEPRAEAALASRRIAELGIAPPVDCSGCHR